MPGRAQLRSLLQQSLSQCQQLSVRSSSEASTSGGAIAAVLGGCRLCAVRPAVAQVRRLSVRAPPEPEGTPASTEAATPSPEPEPAAASVPKARPGRTDPYFLIPLIGLPGLAVFYAYQWYQDGRHKAKIAAIHEEIKQERAARSAGRFVTPAHISQQLDKSKDAVKAELEKGKAAVEAVVDKGKEAVKAALPAKPAESQKPASSNSEKPPSDKPDSAPPAGSTPPPAAKQPAKAQTSAPASTAAAAASAAASAALRMAGTTPVETTPQTNDTKATASSAPAAQSSSTASASAAQAEVVKHEQAKSTEPAVPAQPSVPAPVQYTPVLTSKSEPEVAPVAKGSMGVTLDLTPSGLVQFANERGLGPGADWQAYTQHHKQAAADAELFGRAAQQISAWHESEVSAFKSTAEQAEKRAKDVEDLQRRNIEGFRRLLRQHQLTAAELRDAEVAQAEKRIRLAATAAQNKERVERSEILDKLRGEINALAAAHEVRVSQQAASRLSHALTLSAVSLMAALESGQPVKGQLEELLRHTQAIEQITPPSAAAAGVSDTSLLKAAAESIPPGPAAKGIPTHTELASRLRALRTTASSLSLIPVPSESSEHSGGIITYAFARLFASLKADDTRVVRALGPDTAAKEGGVTGALAAAEHLLSQGELLSAIKVLSQAAQGSAAAVALQSWIEDASARAKAEQAAHLLRAHATVIAAASMG